LQVGAAFAVAAAVAAAVSAADVAAAVSAADVAAAVAEQHVSQQHECAVAACACGYY